MKHILSGMDEPEYQSTKGAASEAFVLNHGVSS
jgi:hypothetical protein